jgi:hypothetical protein
MEIAFPALKRCAQSIVELGVELLETVLDDSRARYLTRIT